jgi:hypothetical protein
MPPKPPPITTARGALPVPAGAAGLLGLSNMRPV